MPDEEEVLLRHIGGIIPASTSHGVGEKRVIAKREDVGYPIIQIARTLLTVGEKVEPHTHPTMDEHFFFLKGESEITIDETVRCCKADDYLYIPAGHRHAIKVISNTEMITIGLETCSKSISE